MIDPTILAHKLYNHNASSSTVDWVMSYLTKRKQSVSFGGNSSEALEIEVGSPQGSVLSPLLFLILTSDIGLVVPELDIVTYADDITVSCSDVRAETVIGKLEEAAQKIIAYMNRQKLKLNPDKTKFIMFGRSKGQQIKVGTATIQKSKHEHLLGVEISQNLTWVAQYEKLSLELSRRLGLLRRLTFHLPKHVLLKLVTPVFTSKLMYAIEIYTDPSTSIVDGNSMDNRIAKLQKLQNRAMRIVLCPASKHWSEQRLLELTQQKSVLEISLQAVSRAAWCSLGPGNKRHVLGELVKSVQHGRMTRSTTMGILPPQLSSGTLVSAMAKVWNFLPWEIREEKSVVIFKE